MTSILKFLGILLLMAFIAKCAPFGAAIDVVIMFVALWKLVNG